MSFESAVCVVSHGVIHMPEVKAMQTSTAFGARWWWCVHLLFDVRAYLIWCKFTQRQTHTSRPWLCRDGNGVQSPPSSNDVDSAKHRRGTSNYGQIKYKLRFVAAARPIHCVSFNLRLFSPVDSHEIANFSCGWTVSVFRSTLWKHMRQNSVEDEKLIVFFSFVYAEK